GNMVETGSVHEVLQHPTHAYTKKLLAAVPHLGASELDIAPLEDTAQHEDLVLDVRNLNIDYVAKGKAVRAVFDANLHIAPGEIVGLVGESGSGKSTIAKAVLGLLPVAEGELKVHG